MDNLNNSEIFLNYVRDFLSKNPKLFSDVIKYAVKGVEDFANNQIDKTTDISFKLLETLERWNPKDPNKPFDHFSAKEVVDSLEGCFRGTEALNKIKEKFNYTEKVAKTTTDSKILVEILRKENDDIVSQYAVQNPNCPPEMLVEVLKRGNNDWVSCYAARNTNCPPEILVEVLKRENDDGVSNNASHNPNCPSEILEEILKREKDDDISYCASENPNCPLEAKIKWMQVTGRIEKEDPSKHIIEYENNKKDDLQDLKNLL